MLFCIEIGASNIVFFQALADNGYEFSQTEWDFRLRVRV